MYVEINETVYDLDSQRAEAHQALLDAGESSARCYLDEECTEPTITVLTDSGTLSQRTGR